VKLHHTATGNHLPYGITQCYLPPAFTPAEAGTRFSDPKGMQGWVDLGTLGANSLPKTATQRRHDCDSNPCSSEPESGTLTTRPPRQKWKSLFTRRNWYKKVICWLLVKPIVFTAIRRNVLRRGELRVPMTFPGGGHIRYLTSPISDIIVCHAGCSAYTRSCMTS